MHIIRVRLSRVVSQATLTNGRTYTHIHTICVPIKIDPNALIKFLGRRKTRDLTAGYVFCSLFMHVTSFHDFCKGTGGKKSDDNCTPKDYVFFFLLARHISEVVQIHHRIQAETLCQLSTLGGPEAIEPTSAGSMPILGLGSSRLSESWS